MAGGFLVVSFALIGGGLSLAGLANLLHIGFL